jgi:hypothetical protein
VPISYHWKQLSIKALPESCWHINKDYKVDAKLPYQQKKKKHSCKEQYRQSVLLSSLPLRPLLHQFHEPPFAFPGMLRK